MDRDRNLQCQFCPKFFPCARSLDGHMRSHVPPPAAAGYGLREKPKRTTSFDDLGENQCSECGREFKSGRALFGHMSSHSQRARRSKEEDAARSLSKKQKRVSPEYPKEQVDGAFALMMLSRDKGNWGNGVSGVSDYDDDSLKKKKKKKNGSNGLGADAAINKAEGLGYQCRICGKVFSSGQALGGHWRAHSSRATPRSVDDDYADFGAQ